MRQMPDAFVAEVRARVDIVDVVSEYVQLRRSGRSFVGLCPFHSERTPSFTVSPDRQLYYCFGCGAGGSVIRFVMDIEGLSFPDAVLRLAERAGLEPPSNLAGLGTSSGSRLDGLRDAIEFTAKLYNHILMNTAAGVQALAYLESRGLSRQTMAAFRLGYAPPRGDVVLRAARRRGYAPEVLRDAGLIVDVGGRWVDRFRDRIIIPICDDRGRVIAFGGRATRPDVQPKYLNSPETALFRKSGVLFHWHAARREIRKRGEAILLEGYMDVISAWQAGVTNAVASLGTAFTREHADRIRQAASRLVIVYDGDAAGVQAAERALDVAAEAGLEVRLVILPDGMDPDDVVRKHGPAAFQDALTRGQRTPVQFLMERLRERAELDSGAGRTAFLRSALDLLAVRASPIEQEQQLRVLAQEFGVSIDALKEELRQRRRRAGPAPQNARDRLLRVEPAQQWPAHIRAGRWVLQAMLMDARAFAYVQEQGVTELADPVQTALLAWIYGYRTLHPTGDPAGLLDELDEPGLRQLATSLLMEEPPLLDEATLADCLRTIELHRLEQWYEQLVRDSLAAQAAGRAEDVRELQQLLHDATRRIAELKQTPSQSGDGVKEAGRI
ncbi:MAG: DNA primase [Thermoflavifilum sp.]|nr:DNA primase [Thermoflavifilum sp.]MCL6514931.1 DNA primase [Alicyclobacillus sp.]